MSSKKVSDRIPILQLFTDAPGCGYEEFGREMVYPPLAPRARGVWGEGGLSGSLDSVSRDKTFGYSYLTNIILFLFIGAGAAMEYPRI